MGQLLSSSTSFRVRPLSDRTPEDRPTSSSPLTFPGAARIELVEVGKSYRSECGGTIRALEGVGLAVETGTLCLLRGPSGSGKTTLLQLIAGILRPSSGRIRIDGRELTRLTEDLLAPLRRRTFGFVFQNPLLIRGASALANVTIPALPDPSWDGDLRPRARALLARLGLASREHEPVERLSGGERQRVSIARALVQDPLVLLADEPTAHLDPEATEEILGLLEELRSRGKTVVVASHDPQLRESNRFDRALDLRDGRLTGGGRPRCS